jgi:6-phosphogluconolactonase
VVERAVEVLDDFEAVSLRAAAFVAERVRAGVGEAGSFSLALSGGRTPTRMIELLGRAELPWDAIEIYQVDERIAPRGDPDRNLTTLEAALPALRIHVMPVDEDDLTAAAARYAAALPEQLDLVHLGLGEDGHTASLVPGCAALGIRDREVAISMEYHGRRRMTLTYPALDRAREVVWVVVGRDKADALTQLMAGDASIPASRVTAPAQIIFADRAAARS